MVRGVVCVMLLGVAWAGQAPGAAPPIPEVPWQVRYISRAELLEMALQQCRSQWVQQALQPCDGDVWSVEVPVRKFDESQDDVYAASPLLAVVEFAYWNLYGAYWQLYSREQGLRLAAQALELSRVRYEAGQGTIADVDQARRQCELFRAQRLQAIRIVQENEQELRSRLDFLAATNVHLVPSDLPRVALSKPDWDAKLEQALRLTFDPWGWRIGLLGGLFDLPGVHRATTEYLPLQGVHQVIREMQSQPFREDRYHEWIGKPYENIRANQAQREAFGEQLRVRQQEYQEGRGPMDILLEAQQFWVDALASEFAAIATYNFDRVAFDLFKDQLVDHANAILTGTLRREQTKAPAETSLGWEEAVLKSRSLPELWLHMPLPQDPPSLARLPRETPCTPRSGSILETYP